LASFDIGAKLRQARLAQNFSINDIAQPTRIPARFLEAIESDDYSSLPGLIFTRNFVRQYAIALGLDPEPLLAELPKLDESTAPLPAPPKRPRSPYSHDQRLRSLLSSIAWLIVAVGAALGAYLHYNHSITRAAAPPTAPENRSALAPSPRPTPESSPGTQPPASPSVGAPAPVQVSLTASQPAWVQVSADGKIAFTGTLLPNETREISAEEQVRVLAGNAGALRISLNGKALDSIGPLGQVRVVKLTAEGPEFLAKTRAPDPL
jgi:cytoskeletal protein RodZ